MKHTANYELNKPERTDFFSIEHQNENMDKVDEALAAKAAQGDVYTKAQADSLLLNKANGGNWTFYSSITQLLPTADETVTMDDIAAAMKDNSMIVFDNYTLPQIQSIGLATIRIIRRGRQRVEATATDHLGEKRWFGAFNDGVTGWLGWQQLATTADLAKRATAGYGLGEAARQISGGDILAVMAENKCGWFAGSDVKNAPTNGPGGSGWYTYTVTAMNGTADYQTCMCTNPYSGTSYIGSRYNKTWSGWKPIVTATPPQEYNLPLAEGFSPHRRCTYFKSQEGIVTVIYEAKTSRINDDMVLATLPVGFRPSTERVFFVGFYGTANPSPLLRTAGGLLVSPSGQITLRPTNGVTATYSWGQFSFLAGA